MFENVQRIRRTAAQNKSKEPVKATFIPGVTKNVKYAHVTSRVGEFLRVGATVFSHCHVQQVILTFSLTSMIQSSSSGRRGDLDEGSDVRFSRSVTGPAARKTSGQNNHQGTPIQRNLDRRLSRSSTDLTSRRRSGVESTSGDGATSAPILRSKPKVIDAQGPGNYVPRAKRKPKGLQIEDESVYNWRFTENSTGPPDPGRARKSQSDSKIQGFHRVEYLPCDGICAEEVLPESPDGSGRSSSRTSRGMNTEETRIIEDFQHLDLKPRSQSMDQLNNVGPGGNNFHAQVQMESQTTASFPSQNNYSNIQDPKTKQLTGTEGRNAVSSQKAASVAELPHSLGTVPRYKKFRQVISSYSECIFWKNKFLCRYLKQRKEEWKLQAEQVAAAVSAADVPPGHVLLPEAERLETLQGLKASMLMNFFRKLE